MQQHDRIQDALSRMDPHDLARITNRIGNLIYVVVSKTGSGIALDPATRRPWQTRNKKQAEMVAQEFKGVVVTWNEALKLQVDSLK